MSKVAYLLGALDRGGTETLLLDTLMQSASLELDCFLIHRKNGTLLPQFQGTGISLYYLPFNIFFDFTYLLKLRKLFKKEGVQIVHAHLPLDAFLAYWACLGLDIKLILSFHGYDFGYSKFARNMVGFISKRTNANLFVSFHLLEYYVSQYCLERYQDKQKFIYNGISFSKFLNFPQVSIRQELGLSAETLLLGCIGNFVIGRDQLTVCKFLAELSNKGIDYHFVFVGARNDNDPSLFDACVKFCEDNNLLHSVHFLGGRSDIPSILKELDAFVYASDHDTFGIAVVEAMAMGVPVFVNDWKVMQEITEQGTFANLYRTKDVNDMLEKFLPFLSDRLSFRRIAEKNAVHVRKKYSIQNHIKNLNTIYKKLLLADD
ncbi:glycosyltransferase family 4 protein [Larkinella sp. GY13]|uniref:glycosyltransferase family 4 protein n=1 Tax=Larkinella sp. GY13 TaxID=3453720 RepID=UPI003EEAF224